MCGLKNKGNIINIPLWKDNESPGVGFLPALISENLPGIKYYTYLDQRKRNYFPHNYVRMNLPPIYG